MSAISPYVHIVGVCPGWKPDSETLQTSLLGSVACSKSAVELDGRGSRLDMQSSRGAAPAGRPGRGGRRSGGRA